MLLANFEYVCTACDPVAHYYARDYARRAHARELACLAEVILIKKFANSKSPQKFPAMR